jgi:hypothetical protein
MVMINRYCWLAKEGACILVPEYYEYEPFWSITAIHSRVLTYIKEKKKRKSINRYSGRR